VSVLLTLIVYLDDEQKEKKVYLPDPKANPRLQDQFCDDHGGRKKIVALDDKPGGKDAPKDDPKAKAEKDAAALFEDALKDEAAKNYGGAIFKLRKLQHEFKETDFVKKEKQRIIEDKIKLLEKAK
jgi:hypothetical protein